MTLKKQWVLIVSVFISLSNYAQNTAANTTNTDGSDQEILISPAVSFLTVAPDARSSGMGDVGAATAPDIYSMYWNPGKLAFLEEDYGGSMSVTPWLRHLVNDMWIGYLNGYMKLRKEDALGVSLQYFDMGSMDFTNESGEIIGNHSPREYALGVTYSRQLSKTFGLAVTAKYINSNLSGSVAVSGTGGTTTKPGNTAAVDVGAYWSNEIRISARPYQLSLGGAITNLGGTISYTNEENAENIPRNLRLGGNLATDIDLYNSINFSLDMNKLLVPTSVSTDGNSFSEQIKEIRYSLGMEYWYAKAIAARLGYYHEHADKGNRKYATVGLGVAYNKFKFDFSYLIPITNNSPLQNTLRISVSVGINKKSPVGTESISE